MDEFEKIKKAFFWGLIVGCLMAYVFSILILSW